MDNDNNFSFWLNTIANIVQLESYEILKNDFNNNDLMRYLQHQDELIEKIINQNEEILHYLKGESNAQHKEND
jgi:hypothetical protein